MKERKKNNMVIAIDGFSSCGKSTFAKAIATELGFVFIDTGAMYRGVTLYALRKGAVGEKGADREKMAALLPEIRLSFRFNAEKGSSELYLNGENVEQEIRGLEVSRYVSLVSQLSEVRTFLVRQQQAMGETQSIVMDGRDIGTVVFPHADLKIFMTASPEVRVQRRYDELKAKGVEVTPEEIRKNLEERDHIDQTREVSPLRKADDAILLDNSHMTVQEQMEWVLKQIG